MKQFSPDQIHLAVELLKNGELVAFPTETVYGLGAPIFDEKSVAKIFEAKGRPADNPLIAHISHLDQINQIAIDIPADFYRLAEFFFPGPLTVVLKKHPAVPSIVSGGLETIAVRMPRHFIAQKLIRDLGQPIVAPSANLSGKPSSTTAAHVLADFTGKIGAVIDGGPTEYGLESTVVNLDTLCLLRLGTVSKEEIEAVLGRPIRAANTDEEVASPGMRYKHYAPKARLKLIYDRTLFVPSSSRLLIEGLKASDLYAALRRADDENYEEIVIFCDKTMQENKALMDRLERASK